MPALIIYLLKVNIALCLFYMAYRFALRRLTFYYLNRVFLVFGIIFSSVYPFVDLSNLFVKHQHLSHQLTVIVPNWQVVAHTVTARQATIDYWQILIALFWTGVVLMAIRLIVQFLSLYRIYKKSGAAHYNGQSFRSVQNDVNPFSFWQAIYLNPDKHTDDELRAIIKHEQIHVKQWHTLDVLLAELSTVFYWFNPGVWLMKQAVKENLEFITDREILQSGVDGKAYQYSLVKVSSLSQGAAIVNNFNFLTIKKRIVMMNKKRSSKAQVTRYVILLPLVMLMVLIFTVSKAELSTNTLSAFVKKVLPRATAIYKKTVLADTVVKQPIVINDTSKKPTNNVTPLIGTIKYVTIDSVHANNITPLIGTIRYVTIDSTRANKTQAWAINTKTDTAIRISGSVGFDASHAVYIIKDDDNKISKVNIRYLNPAQIDSINVIQGTAAVAAYGAKGKNGAVIIKLKKNGTGTNSNLNAVADVKAVVNGSVIKVVSISGTSMVLTRDGDNFSAYSNLNSAVVAKGDKIIQGQVIGTGTVNQATGEPDVRYELYNKTQKVSEGNVAEVTGISYTIDLDDATSKQFDDAKKLFKDNGFALDFKTDYKNNTLKKLSISVSSKHKDNSASASFSWDDSPKCLVQINADPKSGAVSISSQKKSE